GRRGALPAGAGARAAARTQRRGDRAVRKARRAAAARGALGTVPGRAPGLHTARTRRVSGGCRLAPAGVRAAAGAGLRAPAGHAGGKPVADGTDAGGGGAAPLGARRTSEL